MSQGLWAVSYQLSADLLVDLIMFTDIDKQDILLIKKLKNDSAVISYHKSP